MKHFYVRPWAVLAVLTAACTGGRNPAEAPEGSRLESASRVVSASIGDLVHRLRITPAEPSPGDTLEIVSTVINTGPSPVEIGSVICGLDLVTPLQLEPVVPQCEAVGPIPVTVAPGDSVFIGPVRESGGIIGSPPGRYETRARHLLEPELWTEFVITVRAHETSGS